MNPLKIGDGLWVNHDGYLQVTRGEHRKKYYHRVKAQKAMEESGRVLTGEFGVHHLCRNRKCPCPDFHLLIWPVAMAQYIDSQGWRNGRERLEKVKRRGRKKHEATGDT